MLENVQDTDAFGSPTVTGFANGLTTLRGYDAATGRLTTIRTGTAGVPKSVQDLEYQWRSNSSLYRRFDRRNTTTTGDDYTDTFAYDVLERVTAQTTSVGASRTLTFGYSNWGNLTSKTSNVGGDLNVTGYTYATTGKPHRLTSVTLAGVGNTLSYDGNGNITTYDAASGNDTFLSYDGQNQVTRITVGVSSGTTTPAARDEFWYDGDGARFLGRESWDDAGVQRQARTVYLGNFEEVIPASGSAYNLVQRTDLSASVRHVRTRTTGGTITARFEYVHRDHLGSVDVVTSAAGAILNNKLSFDAFGGRRAAGWNADLTAPAMATILLYEDERFARGYTDHEQLNRTGFIHMNGRVYDPRIGRFVSPDPIVQAPWFSQSYNRYAYVFNSPLSFTDPSGYECEPECRPPNRPGDLIYDPFYIGPTGPTCDEIAPSFLCQFGFEAWSEWLASVLDKIGDSEAEVADSFVDTAFRWFVYDYEDPLFGSHWWESAAGIPALKPLKLGKVLKAARATGPVFKTTKEAAAAAEKLGFRKVNERVHGQAVYSDGKRFITRDADGHQGGAWKVSDSIEGLAKKETRSGTYSADLSTRVGD